MPAPSPGGARCRTGDHMNRRLVNHRDAGRELAPGGGPTDDSQSEIGLEHVPACDLCGSDEVQAMFATVDRLHRLPGAFALVRCASCGLVRLSPRPDPDSVLQYYPSDAYQPHQEAGIGTEGGARRLRGVRDGLRDEALRNLGYPRPAHRWARLPARLLRDRLVRRHAYGKRGFPPFRTTGRALDLGAGNGFFLALLRQNGWAVDGMDLSASAADATKRSFGLDVHVGQITDDVFEPESFDFIHMSHVIEHVPSPTRTMERVLELLRPGGLLYVETPNIDSVAAKVWGPLWYGLDSPRHFWLFSRRTMARLLGASGFEVQSIRSWVLDEPEWEATYLFERRTGMAKQPRPSIGTRERPRTVVASGVVRAAGVISPARRDVMGCWAVRPPSRAGP